MAVPPGDVDRAAPAGTRVTPLQDRLQAQGVHTLLLQFTDLHGVAKGKLLPLAHAGRGAGPGRWLCRPVDRRHRPAAHRPAVGVLRARRRRHRLPAAVVAWRGAPGRRRFRRRCTVRGLPAPGAAPGGGAAGTTAAGTLQTGIEPEFFLLRRAAVPAAPHDRWEPADPLDRLDKPSYDLKSLPRQAGFLHALRDALERLRADRAADRPRGRAGPVRDELPPRRRTGQRRPR